MRFHCPSILRAAGFVTLAVTGGFLGPATQAQAEETSADAEETPADAEETSGHAEKTSVELRFTLVSAAARWSPVDSPFPQLTTHAKRSVYFGPGVGVRVFIKQPHHGLLVDFDYRIDTDVDTANVLEGDWRIDFAMAHVGYAYRFLRRANERMTWAFTPHASFSAGGSINRNKTTCPTSSAVLGGRVGVNVDFHIKRFFMGWAVEYEGVRVIRGGPIKAAHFLRWTLIPVFRIGVDLGPRIQAL